jgi:predicted dehydrogenase
VTRHHGIGAWVESHDAPDHVFLHMDHENGAHTMVEISYSYGHTSRDQRCKFVYELIGTDGVIRYDRQSRVFEMVNKSGTHHMHWHDEKNFDGMYHEFENALRTGKPGDMPTGTDGLLATRIAQTATAEAMKSRPKSPSSRKKSEAAKAS